MDTLLLEHQARLARINDKIQRYLYQQVDFSNRLIAIKGARGSGKTTLLLQWAKKLFAAQSTLYVSLDHIWFYENKLYDLAKRFVQFGGTHLLLDEVHKYPDWSREIKLIYDNFPELSIVFTSSSVLEIYKSESDLSRRVVSYDLKELSFREFIAFETGKSLSVYSLDDLLENHSRIAAELIVELKPLPLFDKYLKIGAYPYYKENEAAYVQKLLNTINLTIEIDVNAVEHLAYETLVKLKKLLKAIASSVPFTPNISKLSEQVGLTRNGLVHAIKILARAGLVHELYKNTSGIGVLTKPEKLYLNNTNLIYALADENAKTGNVRETFFLNQLERLHTVNLSEKADFLIDNNFAIEVGGRNKTKKQILGLNNAYIAKDQVEVGYGNVIPLWLFGFLY